MTVVVAGDVVFDVDAVAFDKDGTLIDLDATWGPVASAWVRGVAGRDAALARAIADHLGLDLDRSALVPDSIFSAGTLDQIRAETAATLSVHGHAPAAVEQSIAAGVEMVLAAGPAEPVPLADLTELFGGLTAVGLRCAVVTADDRVSAERALATLGLDRLTATVVGGDETVRPKPAPDALHLAAERLAVPTGRLLMVGDSLTDQGAARAAGCPFVAIGRGTAAAADCDAVLDHVGQLRIV